MTDLSQAMTELLYRSYRAQRENGADHGLLHRSGVYGEEIDNFSDRYYEEQKRADGWEPNCMVFNEHGLGPL
jgi:hypothetical protein